MIGTVSDRSSPSAGRYPRWRICADMGGFAFQVCSRSVPVDGDYLMGV